MGNFTFNRRRPCTSFLLARQQGWVQKICRVQNIARMAKILSVNSGLFRKHHLGRFNGIRRVKQMRAHGAVVLDSLHAKRAARHVRRALCAVALSTTRSTHNALPRGVRRTHCAPYTQSGSSATSNAPLNKRVPYAPHLTRTHKKRTWCPKFFFKFACNQCKKLFYLA